MKKQKTIFFVMIVSLVFNAAFLGGLAYRLHEKSRPPKPGFPPGFRGEPFRRERVEIPVELRMKMRDIYKDFSPHARGIWTQLREERNALLEILMADKPDSAAIENQLKRIGEFQLEKEREVVHRLFREKDLLPLEQRRQFLEMMMRRLGGSSRPPGVGPGRPRNHSHGEEKGKDR